MNNWPQQEQAALLPAPESMFVIQHVSLHVSHFRRCPARRRPGPTCRRTARPQTGQLFLKVLDYVLHSPGPILWDDEGG